MIFNVCVSFYVAATAVVLSQSGVDSKIIICYLLTHTLQVKILPWEGWGH